MATTIDVPLEDGRALRVVQQAGADKPADLAQALAPTGVGAVVVLAGGDDEPVAALKPRLVQLLSRGLLRAVREARALCIARAGASGLAGMLGRAAADGETTLPLLGVGPAARLMVPGQARDGDDAREPIAPGLTHLLLTPGADWGSEMRTKIDVAQALADGTPALMVVIGGGAGVAAEVLQAVRRRWAVLVVKGSGGVADELARQWADRAADGDDPVVAEILADANLTCITLGERVGEAVETMARHVLRDSGGDSVLRQAWRRFAAVDAAAVRQQSSFMTVQMRILALGVVAVVLAIVQTLLKDNPSIAPWLFRGLGFVLIVVPIGTSVLIATTNRFKPGKRWVLLRSAAESIKREIYCYRLRAGGYAGEATREKNLAKAVEDITRRLARTEANTTSLPVYTGPIPPQFAASPGDDGMSFLTTEQYVRLRLDDQLRFYRRKTVTLESEFSRLQIWVLFAGAAGTLLAALGGSAVIWIALTTALASAFMTHLSYRQVESTLVGYNQTATDLENILAWWTSLAPEEQALPANIEALSSYTEQVLASELAGWTQRMTDALEKLREAPEPEPRGRSEADAKESAPAAASLPAAPANTLPSDPGEVAHNAAGTQDAPASEATPAAPTTADAGEPAALDKPADKKA